MRVSIVGAGLQARRRLPVIVEDDETTAVAVASANIDEARALANVHGLRVDSRWEETVEDPSVDSVVVCSTPDSHAEIAAAAIANGKHLLVEKPMTRSAAEAAELVQLARDAGTVLRCGFNHRFHPAISRATELVADGAIGRPRFLRGLYGIGGRSTMASEWRGDPTRAAGGHLMEQGIHLVDIALTIHPGVHAVIGHVDTVTFPIAPLEDIGTILLLGDGFSAAITASMIQWRNTFALEIAGDSGYVQVEGLGGSYGTETLTVGSRDEHAPFTETKTYFRGPDPSWRLEWQHFRAMVAGHVTRETGASAVDAMSIVEAAYESSRLGQRVPRGWQ
jgi:predicted dehydrogenase